MTTRDELYLHEEVLLLALRDTEGTIAMGTMYMHAIGGAVLAELLLDGAIRLDGSKKNLVSLTGTPAPSDPLIDECVEKIASARKEASLQAWVAKFAGLKDLRDKVAIQLCRRGILRADEDKVLLVFTRKIYPEIDPEPERRIIARLREAIFESEGPVDPRTTVLVSLAHHGGLLKHAFDRKELGQRKDRIEQIMNGEAVGAAAQDAIEAMQAAMMVAVILPAIIVPTIVN